MLQRRGAARRRLYPKSQVGKRDLPLTFRNFSILLFSLIALAYTPYLYQRLFHPQGQLDCQWLKNPPLVCAHGGDSSRAFPNTRAAYKLALEAGVDCIEIDASRTSDGLLFALHDRELQRMAGKSDIRVGELTASQIKKLDPAETTLVEGFPEQSVPTLEDAIEYVQQKLKAVIIDAKVGPLYQERLASDLVSTVRRTECRHCLVWAKEDELIGAIIRRSASTKTGYIVMNDTATGKVSKLRRLEGADVVGVYHGLVSGKLVRYLHRAGRRVYAWTVNTGDAMVEMLKAGVDAIITNDPKLLQSVMQEQKQLCRAHGFAAF